MRENAARALRLVENWRQDIIKSRKPEFRQEVLAFFEERGGYEV
ncbi:MAG: hypothetical protein PHX14_11250 [Syntrophomonadaceae bacterium]|nr:hypothetical protein [Syntrophomonadaceae bacterium]